MPWNPHVIAIIAQEGGKLLTEILRTRPTRTRIVEEPVSPVPELEPPGEYGETSEEGEKEEVAIACVPCAIGHYGTCTGLLNEAMRFAKKDGLGSKEVITRVQMCLAELNAMERVDLRPEMTVDLPPFEKRLANKALVESRNARHALENMGATSDLERAAADLQKTSNDIGVEWYQNRLQPKEAEKVEEG
jgi:hypothetical protein